MPDPRVVAVCPIRNRAWIVREHVWKVIHQRRPPERLFYLTGDNKDDTESILRQIGGYVHVDVFDRGSPHWHRSRPGEKYTGDNHANLAAVYNELLDRALACFDASHFWLLDSDVLPEPDCLAKLLEVDEPIVSAVVEHSPGVFNFMLGRGKDGEPRRTGDEQLALVAPPDPTRVRVSFVSCCTLIRREVLTLKHFREVGAELGCDQRADGHEMLEAAPLVRFAPHPRSQDFPFCARAEAAGFKLWVQPAAHAEHRMEEPEDG